MEFTTALLVALCALGSVCGVQDLDVSRVDESTLQSLKTDKFAPFQICEVKCDFIGRKSRFFQHLKLLMNVRFVDESKTDVKMLITTTDPEMGGAYEIKNFNVDPSWGETELMRQVKSEIICGLFDGIIADIPKKTLYVVKYYETTKQRWWCDVYNQNELYQYVETEECYVLVEELNIMSRATENSVDSPEESKRKLVANRWNTCSAKKYPDQDFCFIGGIKTIVRYYCRKSCRPFMTFGFRLIHTYQGKEIGSYTLPNSEKLRQLIRDPIKSSHMCSLFRFKIDDDNKIHIQYLSYEASKWWELHCDLFVLRGGKYEKVEEDGPCTRYRGDGVHHTYTSINTFDPDPPSSWHCF